jgi:DNA-binding protein HU-beta
MAERLEKVDVVDRVSERLSRDPESVAEIVDAFLDEIYEAFKRGESVSLRGFGSFYIRPEPESWVFKFNPSQRLRRVLGWSSTYHGPL